MEAAMLIQGQEYIDYEAAAAMCGCGRQAQGAAK